AHPLSGRDRKAASVAGFPQAGTMPKLNRAITREQVCLNPLPDELPDAGCSSPGSESHNGLSREKLNSPMAAIGTDLRWNTWRANRVRSIAWVLIIAGFAAAVVAFWIGATRPLSNPWVVFVMGIVLAIVGVVLLARQR